MSFSRKTAIYVFLCYHDSLNPNQRRLPSGHYKKIHFIGQTTSSSLNMLTTLDCTQIEEYKPKHK